jgi:hypothetical protein
LGQKLANFCYSHALFLAMILIARDGLVKGIENVPFGMINNPV